jgi:endo-1,4-beta-xylanase
MKNTFYILTVIIAFFLVSKTQAQNIPVILQAEFGALGSDFRIIDTLGIKAVTIKTDLVNSAYPGNTKRIITFTATFPDSGTYELYARILTGPGTFNDDSYFYGNGFGTKNSTLGTDWLRANGLAGVGYSGIYDVVNGGGAQGSGIWKWINMSKYAGDGTPISFRVELGALTKTFQIGARENGLYFDKFAFGRKGLYFTVSNLNRGEAGSLALPSTEPTGIPLANGKSKFLGSEWDYVQAPNFAGYWNQSTPGNAGKWGSVEGTRNVMNWTVLDSTYNVARRYHMAFKEHTLIWGAQQPSWIGSLDSATQRQEIEQWFSLLAARYDTIEYIDVVNEPINNAPDGMIPWGTTTPNVNYTKALGGKGTTGYDWIITAFRLARKYFPNSKLIMNEYNVINSTTTTQKMVQIVNLLKADTLIDGIGEQGHAFTTYGVSATTLKTNLDALAATGIPLYITEMDIDGLTDIAQLQEYQRVFPVFWKHAAIKGITMWGFRYGVWRNDQGAYLITNDDVERPAMKWLKAYVNDTLTIAQSIAVTSQGDVDTIMVGNSVMMTANFTPANTTIKNVTWNAIPNGIVTIDSEGKITAIAAGNVTVKANAWDGSGKLGSKVITVINPTTDLQGKATSENISIYPNPSYNGNINIDRIEKFNQLEIINIVGETIYQIDNLSQSTINININTKPGIYFIKLTNKQNTLFKKITIK